MAESNEFGSRTKAFEEFLAAKGILMSPKVAIADFRQAGQGRGLVALDDIEEDEVLFSIPQSALLRADQDQELMQLTEKYDLDPWSALILRMMAVQSSSEWKPYFDILPSTFNTPMFWDVQETKDLLKGSEVVEKIGREEADGLYDQLASGVLKEKYFNNIENKDRDTFHRMGSLIMSYAFDVPDSIQEAETREDEEADSVIKAMVPLADTLNSHTKLQNARLTTPETPDGKFEMIASKRINKGDQIYNIYGNQPSSDMLRRYGFVEAGGTSYEIVEVSLDMLVKAACSVLKLPRESIENRLEALAERLHDEVPDAFEIGLTLDEDKEDAVPEIEYEPILLITVNALCIDALKRKDFKTINAMVEDNQELYPEAKQMLREVIKARSEQYGAVPPAPTPEHAESLVLLDKSAMAAQVRLSELRVLDMALDWLNTEENETLPQAKKQKTES